MVRLPMGAIKEVLRLRFQNNLSYREISRSTGVAKSTASDYCNRFKFVKLSLSQAFELREDELEKRLFPERELSSKFKRPLPDFEYISKEIRKKGVTWLLLWQEYKESNPEGYNYTQFKKYCQEHISKLNPVMRQLYKGGETMFVDYSGLTMEITDPQTGEVTPAQIFVAALGASTAVFVHATLNQKKSSFILSHTLAFEYFGGVPKQIIPDNLKSAVTENSRKRLELNASYEDMARHYGSVIIPTRPKKPQDKAKVEQAVQGIQRWILAKLRNRIFFSIEELNAAIDPLLEEYNSKIMKGLGKSRFELLEELDKPELIKLHRKRYVYRDYLQRKVHLDYHVEVEGSFYSVPYNYIKSKVEIWYSNTTVEIYSKGKLISIHPRLFKKGSSSTLDEHMPPEHQYRKETWNPGRILNWASSIGFNTARLMKEIMESKSHSVKAYRICIAILNLNKKWDKKEIELSCKKASEIRAFTVKSIESILKNKMYLEKPVKNTEILKNHRNIRGKKYYEKEGICC
jgi:transposase